ncbi:MAG: DUF1573 domain-containing protein [Bacteroidota bacterium]|nr:DUF1573 domain-containing protein [Bacteroidota bacterium]
MKRIAIVLIVLLFVLPQIFGQDKGKTVDKKKQAEITFEKTIHDFGTIPYRGDGKCEFVFKNTGKSPLVLTNVKSSCGCTVPTWPREPIAKKKEGTIKVKYDTKRQGRFTKTITVYCNASNSPVRLTVRGEVTKPTAEEMDQLRKEREERAAKNRAKYNRKNTAKHRKSPIEKEKSLLEKEK